MQPDCSVLGEASASQPPLPPPRCANPLQRTHLDIFKTCDVDLSAYLVCRGLKLQRIEAPANPPPWLCEFCFEDNSVLYELLREWGSDEEGRYVDALSFSRERIRLYRRARDILDGMRGR